MVFKDIEIRDGRFSQPANAIEKPDAQSRVVTRKVSSRPSLSYSWDNIIRAPAKL